MLGAVAKPTYKERLYSKNLLSSSDFLTKKIILSFLMGKIFYIALPGKILVWLDEAGMTVRTMAKEPAIGYRRDSAACPSFNFFLCLF